MSTIPEIIRAAERLDPDGFLKLRTSLDRDEEPHTTGQSASRY